MQARGQGRAVAGLAVADALLRNLLHTQTLGQADQVGAVEAQFAIFALFTRHAALMFCLTRLGNWVSTPLWL